MVDVKTKSGNIFRRSVARVAPVPMECECCQQKRQQDKQTQNLVEKTSHTKLICTQDLGTASTLSVAKGAVVENITVCSIFITSPPQLEMGRQPLPNEEDSPELIIEEYKNELRLLTYLGEEFWK
ncbi:hypothetical protein ACJJTC_003338 [Scirpophaga incertulas]